MSRRAVRRIWPLVVAVVLIGVCFLAVFPTRTYLAQRRARAAAVERLRILEAQNRKLAERARELHTDAEIERIAREQYNLVRPGEEAYALLPAGEAPTTTAVPRKPERRGG